jgi:hypothetical protein
MSDAKRITALNIALRERFLNPSETPREARN